MSFLSHLKFRFISMLGSGAMLKTEKLEQISIQGLLLTKHQHKYFILFNILGNSAVDISFKFFTVFKGYFPFTVITKYWLCSLCYTITSAGPLVGLLFLSHCYRWGNWGLSGYVRSWGARHMDHTIVISPVRQQV